MTDSDTDSLPPHLLANLAAMRSLDPTLVERITWPCASEHVAWTEGEGAEILVHRTWHRLSLTRDEVVAALGDVRDAPVLLFGLGLGELLGPLLAAGCTVDAWERDPWLLRTVLSRQDWSLHIASGRLRFRLTSDLVGLLATSDATAPDGRALQPVFHPILEQLYTLERRLLEDGVGPRRALLALGGLFVEDVADALRAEGFSVFPWELVGWSREELHHVADALQPELAVAINHTHGLPGSCAELGVPLHVWEIDPATDQIAPVPGGSGGPAASNTNVWTWRRSQVAAFSDAGFDHVAHLPLAANPEHRRPLTLTPAEEDQYGADVIFVGSSMVETAMAYRRRLVGAYVLWKGGDPSAAVEEAEAAIHRVLDAQRDSIDAYLVPELLAKELPWFVQAATENDAVFGALEGARPASLLGELAAADKRITCVANLGQVGIHVWGDEGWQHAAEYGAVYRGPAGHREELTRIYSTPAIHVDIGRFYQEDIVTMRVFDVLACGGFCLAQWSEDLEALFEVGVELDTWRTLEELLEKTGHWLEQGPEARAAVGARGRARILRDHSIQQRVQRMLGR